MIRARAMLVICGLALGCAGERRSSAARTPEADPQPVQESAPSIDPPAPSSETSQRPPPGTPTVDAPFATLWTDPARGLILRAARDPSPLVSPETAAWGEVTIVARDRNAPGHLVREWDGDLYWVEYRRADARCDFVRLANGASEPEILFEDALGDFSETICDTAVAVEAGGRHVFWIHGSEIRAVPPERGARPRILARGQPYPREIANDETHVYWLALGADPYEDDLTERGSLRAVPIEGGRVRVLAERLTEPHGLVITGTHVGLRESGEQVRQFPRAAPPIPP